METLGWTVVFLSRNIWGGDFFCFCSGARRTGPCSEGCRVWALPALVPTMLCPFWLPGRGWMPFSGFLSAHHPFLGKTVSLYPTSFWTPRPNLAVTPTISWLPTFAFQSPIMKSTSFLSVSSRKSCRSSRVLPREHTGHSKHPLPTTQEKSLHMDTTRWSILKSDWLYSLQPKMEKLYTVRKKQDWELTVAQIMNSLLPNSDLN